MPIITPAGTPLPDSTTTAYVQKSFDQLQADAAARWAEVGRIRAERARTIDEQITSSADVINAPVLGSTWTPDGITCPVDGTPTFTVNRYACVNGQKTRCELACTTCAFVGTWDWSTLSWTS